MDECIFCKITKGEIGADVVLETENVVAFNDIRPSAEIHILIVPKRHIKDFEEIKPQDSKLISEMIEVAQKVIEMKNPKNYRVIINGRGYLEVDHLHWHLQAGKLSKHAIDYLLKSQEK